MKKTFLDSFIGVFSPSAALNRVTARAKIDLALRAYDIAKTSPQSDWVSATANDPQRDTKAALSPGREKSRALVQNNPYAKRAVEVIVADVVGTGIIPKITGRNSSSTKKLNALWKEVSEKSSADLVGKNNFYALQSLATRSMVETGEALALLSVDPTGPKVKLLEPDFIATLKDEGNIKQGIEVDADGKPTKYHLFKTHPGALIGTSDTFTVPANQLVHLYRQDRVGQLRGITWAHAVVEKIKDFDDYQNATLIRQKIAACFTAFVTNSSDSLVDSATLKAKREASFALSPASIRFLGQGEDIKFASPPGAEGYADFNRETLRAIAVGYGITVESLTGDYSQSNYSSSRLAHLQARKNIHNWRWHIVIPGFCEPFFKKFLEYAATKGIDTNDVTVDWVPPAMTMIDPGKEIEAEKEAVLAGFKSRAQVIREQGEDPDAVREEIKAERSQDTTDDLKFDTNVSSTTPPAPIAQGNTPNESKQSKEDATAKSDSGNA